MSVLSDDDLRLKCAEAAGWVKTFEDEWGPLRGFRDETNRVFEVPDYISDLNACASLRALLTEDERDVYSRFMYHNWTIGQRTGNSLWAAANATARQHCEAFLHAKGAL